MATVGGGNALILTNRHTGEVLELRRVTVNDQPCLELRGMLPPHRHGPPLHVHHAEAEEFHVIAGTLSAEVNGHRIQLCAGESVVFPPGSAHRWWNDGDETLELGGYVKPVVDFDRSIQAAFDVLNRSSADRPSPFYMAHLGWRHRQTQSVRLMPRPIQAVLLPLVVLVGSILGRYRGKEWPGSPERCTGAPLVIGERV